MVKKGVWSIVSRDEVPTNKTIVDTKWVFKIKVDQRFISRLVARGFLQKAGSDFGDIHAPVINDMSLRIILLLKIKRIWQMIIFDIEAAFLEGTLEEEIYIEIPQGLKYIESMKENVIGKLNKSIYGLVQEAQQFYKTIILFLEKDLGLERSISDPCLLASKERDIIIRLYIDDLLITGEKEKIVIFVKDIKERFTVRIIE